MTYRVVLLRAARREFRALTGQRVYERISGAFESLEKDPRPPGCLKLTGREAWRIRVGDYRIIYTIDDAIRVVSITKVGHRSDIYD